MAETKPQSPQPKRRRAHQSDGKFKGNNPDTNGNEAYEPIEIDQALPTEKAVKYKVETKVNGTSTGTAGKYSKSPKVRPTFGSVYTTTT